MISLKYKEYYVHSVSLLKGCSLNERVKWCKISLVDAEHLSPSTKFLANCARFG